MTRFITPDRALFVLLCFEGPDLYSQAGGLGIRMTELSRVLSEQGFINHFFFIGDCNLPGEEKNYGRKQVLHRWCQWVSGYHPEGVYEGEEGKRNEWDKSLPPYLVEHIIKPAACEGRPIVILAEDWHTARTVHILDALLREQGLRDSCIILWNANNEFGFHHVDLRALDAICTVTTVSSFMRRRLLPYGVDPLVLPNGIPGRIIGSVDPFRKHILRESFRGLLLQKTGRFDPNKRWMEAIHALAILKESGAMPHLVMRGGREPYRREVMGLVERLGLSHAVIRVCDPSYEHILNALRHHSQADIIEMDFYVPEEFLMLLYGTADTVLANSGYEPFGIVGLEVMAKGGIAIVGDTGEDYARSFFNSFRVQNDDPAELVSFILRVNLDRGLHNFMRNNALITAREYVWENVLDKLIFMVEEIGTALGQLV
ncbi:MAG: glycosyltransferase [Candidatus Eremiobacteraeota bacterium]|nr:glycosyltransferase [Candidatus Eremiobacteraeota bacterium]